MPQCPPFPQQAIAVSPEAFSHLSQLSLWSLPWQQPDADVLPPSFMQDMPSLPSQQDMALPSFAADLCWQQDFASLPAIMGQAALVSGGAGALWLAVWAMQSAATNKSTAKNLIFIMDAS